MKTYNEFILIFLWVLMCKPTCVKAYNLERGKNLFNQNCIACHKGGQNVIIPEKNLKRLTLEANGMYSNDAIIYQVLNGKNGMPAFGGRLTENEIEDIAGYIMISAENNFEN